MIPTKCSASSLAKQSESVFWKTADWFVAAMFWNQSDFIVWEHAWLNSANYRYQRAWNTEEMIRFKPHYDSFITKKIGTDKDFAAVMLKASMLYNEGKSRSEVNEFLDGQWTVFWTPEKDYISYAHQAILSFVNEIRNIDNSNLVWIVEWWLENKLYKESDDGWRGKFNAFFALSDFWQGENNILRGISLFSQSYKNSFISEDKEVFINAFQKLFWEWKNNYINKNRRVVRNATANLMGYSKKDWYHKAINKFLRFSAFFNLWKYFAAPVAWSVMWVAASFTSYMNIKTMKKEKSDNELIAWLAEIWVIATDIWMDRTLSQMTDWSWIREVLEPINTMYKAIRNQTWWAVDWFSDQTGKIDWYVSRTVNSWFWRTLLSGMPNIFWDAIFRGEYFKIALDVSLKRLWWTGNINNYLYKVDPQSWMRYKDMDATITLLNEFSYTLWSLIGTSQIEWWTQTSWWAWNKFYWLMTQWSTRFANNNVYKMIGWLVYNIIKDTGYKWFWWEWMIRQYTSKLENWFWATPWEGWMTAQDEVSKEEVFRERVKVIDAFQMALRFAKEYWCRDEEGNVDWECSIKKMMGIAYLPTQALQTAHPLVNWVIRMITEGIVGPAYWHLPVDAPIYSIVAESVWRNLIRPVMRALWPLDIITKAGIDAEWAADFLDRLQEAVLKNANNFAFYVTEDVDSFTAWPNAFVPRSLTKDSTMVFWQYNWDFKDGIYQDLSIAKKLNWDYPVWRLILWQMPVIKHFINDFDTNDNPAKVIKILDADEWFKSMMKGELPENWKKDKEFMQYVWNTLTKDRQWYAADYEWWVRLNEYNKWEISYWEVLLKEAMDKEYKKDPFMDKFWAYNNAMKAVLSEKDYSNIKKMLSQMTDAGLDSQQITYMDRLANAHRSTNMTWVKWLAIASEYRKLELMKKYWITYQDKDAKSKELQTAVENKVAEDFWPLLYFADRRAWHNISMKYAVERYPEIHNMWMFKNVREKENNKAALWNVDTASSAWLALRSYTLARTEIAKGNVDWYMLHNVISEKVGNPITKDELWNYKFDPKKATDLVNTTIYISEAMKEMWYSQQDQTHALIPTLTKNIETRELARKNKELFAKLWEDKVDYIDNLLYNHYTTIKWMPEALEYLKDSDTINKIFKNNSYWKNWYSSGYWSNYYWKTPYKDYDLYKQFYPKFLERWSNNLSRLTTAYGKWTNHNSSWNYSSREYAYLNARARWNPLISQRIAPDIQFSGGWFSRKSVKVSLAYGLGWAARIETKNPKFASNKTIARWEWIDRQLPSDRTKRYNNISDKSKSKNRSTWSRLPNNSRGNKVSG